MKLNLATSALRRDTGNLPELRLVNMFAERTRAAEGGVVLQSRPGLSVVSTAGSGPVAGIYSREGIFNGDVFCVSGGNLYRNGVVCGAVGGAGPVSWAAVSGALAITRGAALYRYNGSSVSVVSFPDGAQVKAVETIGSYFYGVRDDTDRIYFSAFADAASWQALDYVSAERRPDPAYDLLNTGEELVILGPESVEFFQETGDADAPIARAAGRSLGIGVKGAGCSAVIDGSLVWIAADNSVRTYDGGARRLSDAAIDERIAASSSVTGFGWPWQGHVFFAVRLDTETLVVDAATGEWWEASSLGFVNWRAQCATVVDGAVLFGDSEAGNLFGWDGWVDADGVLERVFSAAASVDRPVTVFNCEVSANVGQTDLLSGQGSSPVMEIRASRDAGNTWGAWRSTSLGTQGNYRARTRINRWGMFDAPGMIFEGRVTDPVPLRISSFGVNEAGGGRAR